MLVTCPQCQAAVKVRDEHAGKMKCPRCTAVVQIPTLDAEDSSKPASSASETKNCPECGKSILATARICRFCRADLADEEKKRPAKPSRYKPCPQCGGKGPEKVNWTPWGSFLGPMLFTHVRCRKCGYGYNGKTGRSNLIPAIGFVLVPVAAIFGLLAFIVSELHKKGYI